MLLGLSAGPVGGPAGAIVPPKGAQQVSFGMKEMNGGGPGGMTLSWTVAKILSASHCAVDGPHGWSNGVVLDEHWCTTWTSAIRGSVPPVRPIWFWGFFRYKSRP